MRGALGSMHGAIYFHGYRCIPFPTSAEESRPAHAAFSNARRCFSRSLSMVCIPPVPSILVTLVLSRLFILHSALIYCFNFVKSPVYFHVYRKSAMYTTPTTIFFSIVIFDSQHALNLYQNIPVEHPYNVKYNFENCPMTNKFGANYPGTSPDIFVELTEVDSEHITNK